MATITDIRTGDSVEREWHGWIRYHRTEINFVLVWENQDGSAEIKLETDKATLTEHWGSFAVAVGYFGAQHGWRGTRMLKWTPKRIVDKSGLVVYNSISHRPGMADYGLEIPGMTWQYCPDCYQIHETVGCELCNYVGGWYLTNYDAQLATQSPDPPTQAQLLQERVNKAEAAYGENSGTAFFARQELSKLTHRRARSEAEKAQDGR